MVIVMILFASDWNRYPTARPHVTTKNTSWLDYALLLKEMGIKNHAFPLALVNQDLLHIDPHDENISKVDALKVSTECAINPWYALREVIKISADGAPESVDLTANRGNVSLWWLYFLHITMFLIQPRQTGKSTSVDALMVVVLYFMTTNTKIALLTKDDKVRVSNVKRIKSIIENLPKFMQLKTKKDVNNNESITVTSLKNEYITNVAQNSMKAAVKTGRGLTLANVHVDEFNYINYNYATISALLSASGAARDSAKAAGSLYGNIFTSTAGYLSTPEGEFGYDVFSKGTPWTEHMYDAATEEAVHEIVRVNSGSKNRMVVKLELNHRQLGYTDDWLRSKIGDSMSSGEEILADYLGIWPTGNSTSPIDEKIKKIITDSRVEPKYTQITGEGYIIRWYITEEEVAKLSRQQLILALDPSEAIGQDDIGMVIRSVTSGAVLAAGGYNETNTLTFSYWICELLVKYPSMTLIVERRSTGASIIDNLLKMLPLHNIDPFKRLFNWVVNDASIDSKNMEIIRNGDNGKNASIYDKYSRLFGYSTAGRGKQSRGLLYGEIFMSALKYTSDSISDRTLADQLLRLRVKNNRIDHGGGKDDKDDIVIAWLLSYWLLVKGNNLDGYGINTRQVLSTVIDRTIDDTTTPEEKATYDEQKRIRDELTGLLEDIRSSNSEITITKLTMRLKRLYSMVEDGTSVNFNIDTVLKEIEDEKIRKRNVRRW